MNQNSYDRHIEDLEKKIDDLERDLFCEQVSHVSSMLSLFRDGLSLRAISIMTGFEEAYLKDCLLNCLIQDEEVYKKDDKYIMPAGAIH